MIELHWESHTMNNEFHLLVNTCLYISFVVIVSIFLLERSLCGIKKNQIILSNYLHVHFPHELLDVTFWESTIVFPLRCQTASIVDELRKEISL
jgi:hypothetical protein